MIKVCVTSFWFWKKLKKNLKLIASHHKMDQFLNEILDFGSKCIALACQTDRNGFVSSLGLTQCVCKIYSCSGHLWQFKSSSHHWLFTDLGCCNVLWWKITVIFLINNNWISKINHCHNTQCPSYIVGGICQESTKITRTN